MDQTVTVVTATTGRDSLMRCIGSVRKQTYANIQHLVVSDGTAAYANARKQISACQIQASHDRQLCNVDHISLPYSVGKDRWNGHRIYAAATYLAVGDFIMYLDDDNFLEPDHVSSMMLAMTKEAGYGFAYRNIVNEDGVFLCQDNCESLGPYHPTILNPNDYLIDVNCYFMRRELALQLTPLWYRKAREPGVMEIDRALVQVLRQNNVKAVTNGKYTVNYAMGGNALSVAPMFFTNGNAQMMEHYKGVLPWKK